jgi:hypothetical protein
VDFDTSSSGKGGDRPPRRASANPPADGAAGRSEPFATHRDRYLRKVASEELVFRIPAGSRKAALVHLGLAAWRENLFDSKDLGEARGREVDEAGMLRALYRSSMGEIEHLLGPILKDGRVTVEGHLAGTGRTALERLGAEVEELGLEDEKRYIDMTPAIFVVAALAMAVRYVSLGLDDQDLYILAGIAFALMYGLRPFFSKMQRPRD